MKKPIIKSFDKVIVLLLFIFGVFSSCSKDDPQPEYGITFMYGVPPLGEGKSIIIKEETNQNLPVINEVDLQD